MKEQEETLILNKTTEEHVWNECNRFLKDFFPQAFLNELRENRQILFRLYKLYLLHELTKGVKIVEDSKPRSKKKAHASS